MRPTLERHESEGLEEEFEKITLLALLQDDTYLKLSKAEIDKLAERVEALLKHEIHANRVKIMDLL